MNNELFELCKQVHERTGWDELADDHPWITERGVIGYKRNGVSPVYTSDYLLGKLPNKIKGKHSTGWLILSQVNKATWSAGYEADHTEHIDDYKVEWSDTPLKSLLKLTISLHKAGELNGDDQL